MIDALTGQLASPFGELLELAERTERQEWGSEEQLTRYLRTTPVERASTGDIEATIARILSGHEEGAVLADAPEMERTLASF